MIKDSILDLAFPQACHSCRGPVEGSFYGVACSKCWAGTQIFEGGEPACLKCGAFVDALHPSLEQCPGCQEHHYDRLAFIGVYEKALRSIVLNLKRLPVIPPIVTGSVLPNLDRRGINNFNLIIPVPLSSKRRVERGFNQAEIIAECISKPTGIPIDNYSLVRKMHTPVHRAAMDKKAREMTVKDAFEVRRPKLIESKAILLVDDVVTSGATVSNCAKVLKKSGAASVEVFTLARAEIRSRFS